MSLKFEVNDGLQLSPRSRAVVDRLDREIAEIHSRVVDSPVWRTIVEADNNQVLGTIREIMLSVHWYQSHTTEAGFHMLGRLPKDAGKILTVLLAHKADEAEHGLWAKRDYLFLGGNPAIADAAASPATFAVAGVWWWLAHHEERPCLFFCASLLSVASR